MTISTVGDDQDWFELEGLLFNLSLPHKLTIKLSSLLLYLHYDDIRIYQKVHT